MQASQIPVKIPIPFANSAGGSFIQNPIPQGSQIGVQAGRASFTDGFVPLNFTPENAGGIPPFGEDMNGVLFMATAWTRWQSAGAMTTFDATFAAAVGGYPQGAVIASATTPGALWMCTQDNNSVNPDTTVGNPGWVGVAFITAVQNSSYVSADDTGTADNYVATPLPLISALQKYQRFQIKIGNANQTSTPTLNIVGQSGALGAKTIINPNGSVLAKSALTAGMIASFVYDGQFMQLQNSTPTGTPLRVLETTGFGQTFNSGNPLVQITCFTQILRNTLQTSTWDGQNFTCGVGEDGLWSVYSFAEITQSIPGSLFNIVIRRIRAAGGAQQLYWPTGTSEPQPSTTMLIDLQVGDKIQFLSAAAGGASTFNYTIINQQGNIPGNYSSIIMYRIEGLTSS